MNSTPNLLDDVRQLMRVRHYSIHTERAYCDWIRRSIRFHGMQSREDLRGGEQHIEALLTHLAVHEQVAPATRNQAMNALVFLSKQVLRQPFDTVSPPTCFSGARIFAPFKPCLDIRISQRR